MWNPTSISPLGPVYLAIADALARDVEAGALKPGERLPTHRALARTLGVNVVTITRAYQEAGRRGLVDGEVGRGTFVAEPPTRVMPNLPFDPAAGEVVDLHVNSTACDVETLDLPALFSEVATDPVLGELFKQGYAPHGFARHRAAGAAWMERSGLSADPDRILITSGVQHALAVVLATLLEPGDTLLVEELTYPGVRALAGMMRLKLATLPTDSEGIDVDALELACKKGLARALYVQPNVQNPLGCVLSPERRARVVELANRYGLPVLEDDTCGYLLESPAPPLCAELPDHGYFLSGTSKSIAPGLRVAYAHVPRAAVDSVAANLAATTWMTPPLMAELAARLIDDGRADRMVAAKRAETLARRELFQTHLGGIHVESHVASAHVWLPLPAPWRGADFVAGAHKAGVAVAPAEHFVVGRANAPHAVRLALGRPERREDVERALRALAKLLHGAPTSPSLV